MVFVAVLMEHLRFGEGGEGTLERWPSGLVDIAGGEGLGERVCSIEVLHHPHDVGVLEEDQLAISVVVGERTERFGAQRHLRVERQTGIEHGGQVFGRQ